MSVCGEELKALYREQYLNVCKVIVAGGRDFENYEYMLEKLDELFLKSSIFKSQKIKIISGMAKGTDTLAVRYADERKLTKIMFPANWKEHPRMAGILRNEDMLTIATHLVAFWNGFSSGTKHMIEIARKKGIPIWTFYIEFTQKAGGFLRKFLSVNSFET